MRIVDPVKEPNRWIEAMLLDLMEQNTPDSKKMLGDGIRMLSNWIEPGLVDQLFGHWIDCYNQILAEHEKCQSNSDQQCSSKDPLVSQE